MGLLSFIKTAGAKLFGHDPEKELREKAAEAQQKIRDHISGYDLHIEDLQVLVEGTTVTLSGLAENLATKQKAVVAAGNVEGVEAVNDMITVKPSEAEVAVAASPEPRYHTVEKGDTLSKIAKTVYGDPMKYPVIFEANRPMLSHPDKIYPGQVLVIPAI